MKNLTKFAILTSALVSCGAFAQSSTISTGGTVTPNACTLSITTAGTAGAQHGGRSKTDMLALLDSSTVSSGPDYKSLTGQTHALTVACSSATKVTLEFVDNKASSLPPAGATTSNSGQAYVIQPFGVGDANNANAHIGMMALYNNNITVNGGTVPGTKLRAVNSTSTWAALVAGSQGTTHPTSITPSYIYAFTPAAGATAPVAITSMEGTIGTEMFLNRPYVAASTAALSFNSNVTVSLRYF